MLRTHKWSYIQHGEDASLGIQLYDMEKDAGQFTNLAKNPEYQKVVETFKARLKQKLKLVRENDL